MLNRKLIAIVLAAAIALCGVSVLAADPVKGDGSGQIEDAGAVVTGAEPAAQAEEQPAQSGDTSSGGTAGEDGAAAEAPQEPAEEPEPEPDPAGTISFANLESRVREKNLNYLILQENISVIDVIDYDKMKDDLRDGLNSLADAQWQLVTSGSQLPSTGNPIVDGALQGMMSMSSTSAAQSLQAQYDSLRETFDDLKEGKIQQDAADAVRQLQNAQNSIVMVTESMYIQLSELQATQKTLDRSLAALDRQIQELELRYELGQISALTLQQAKAGRTTLVSNQETLSMSAKTLAMNLENMVGADLTGTVRLTALPKVSDRELDAMDLEADLAAAKEVSFTLYDAKNTLDDAKEDLEDAKDEYKVKDYQYAQAEHTWQAAQYTYQNTVQSFELSFRTLYAQVKDYKQVLDAARTSLAVEESNYAADQLKYEQGTISKNTLLTAQDDLESARDTVATAERNLFSAYNNYRWAVDHGILN